MAEPLERLRRKLRFRSLRRGTRESDLVIGGFAAGFLDGMNGEQLGRFEALLDQNDQDVLGWVAGVAPPPARFDNDVLQMLKDFRKTLQDIA